MGKKGGKRVSAEEQKLRGYRMKNLDLALKQAHTTPQELAKKLDCDTSYVSQLRNGFRPITSDVARTIEEKSGWRRFHLDSAVHREPTVSPITDKEVLDLIQQLAKGVAKKNRRAGHGDLFDAAVKFATIDANERGFSEGRVTHILEEFLK